MHASPVSISPLPPQSLDSKKDEPSHAHSEGSEGSEGSEEIGYSSIDSYSNGSGDDSDSDDDGYEIYNAKKTRKWFTNRDDGFTVKSDQILAYKEIGTLYRGMNKIELTEPRRKKRNEVSGIYVSAELYYAESYANEVDSVVCKWSTAKMMKLGTLVADMSEVSSWDIEKAMVDAPKQLEAYKKDDYVTPFLTAGAHATNLSCFKNMSSTLFFILGKRTSRKKFYQTVEAKKVD